MANTLHIVTHPDPRLRQRSEEVIPASLKEEVVQTLIDDMIGTMWQADGIGLAAPQVGHSQRIIIMTQDNEAVPLINPVMTSLSFSKDVMEEGCLSVPGFYGPVKRSTSLKVSALDRRGQRVRFRAIGLPARIIQHEIDHLDGILFIDRAKRVMPVETAPRL